MKYHLFYLLFAASMLAGSVSFAQQTTMMAGKITDENNNPIPGAIIKVSNRSATQEATSDEGGRYYTRLLSKGLYKVEISANNQLLKMGKTGRIYLAPCSKLTKYHNFKVTGNHVGLRIVEYGRFAVGCFYSRCVIG